MARDSMLKLTFFENILFAEDKTGTTLKGYEPALVKVDGAVKPCRIFDPKRMDEATPPVRFNHATAMLSLVDGEHDLGDLLKATENGHKWLTKFGLWRDAYVGEDVPMTLNITKLPRAGPYNYGAMPKDYFDRTEKNSHYQPPGGAVMDVPKGCWYGILLPPMKTRHAWISRGVNYHRKCASKPRTMMDSYWFEPIGFNDWDDERRKRTPLGVLLGTVEKQDFQYTHHDFEDCLPLHHYLEVVYTVAIRDAARMNPVGITLCMEK